MTNRVSNLVSATAEGRPANFCEKLPKISSIRTKVFLVILLLVYAFAFQSTRALWNPDEGRYTNLALNMVRTGEWLMPKLDDETPHFTKPPLTYWTLAFSFTVFGKNEFAARFPNAIAFAASVILVYILGTRIVPRRAWLAALIYATLPLTYMAANVVTTDTILTLWEIMAVASFVIWWGRYTRLPWNLMMWVSFGLGFLTKGPPALLPLAVIIIWTVTQKRPGSIRRLLNPIGLALFLIIGFEWYIQEILIERTLFRYFVYDEIFARVFTSKHHRNSEWYSILTIYLPVLTAGALPWSVIILRRSSINALMRLRKTGIARFFSDEPWAAFCVLWFTIPLILFCLAQSRLILYVLPLFAPLSLILARLYKVDLDWLRQRRVMLITWILLLVFSRGAVAWFPEKDDTGRMAEALRPMLPKGTDEIVFLEGHAFYGLQMYLDAEVELVSMKKKIQGVEFIDDELRRHEPGRLFMVKEKYFDLFQKKMFQMNGTYHIVGEYDEWHVLVIDPLKPAKGFAQADVAIR